LLPSVNDLWDQQKLNLNEFELIITDLNLPGTDGIEVIRKLASSQYQGFIIIISGEDKRVLNTVLQLGHALKLNILGALQKPFSQDELHELISYSECAGIDKKAFEPRITLSLDEIEHGIENNKLMLFYQPKVLTSDNSIVSVEALARWKKDDGGVLGPDSFIPVAENSHLIHSMTTQIFGLAAKQLSQWRKSGLNFSVAVNFSMKTIENIELPDTLENICQSYQLKPKDFIVEITESAIMSEKTIALDVISRLHLKGFKLSIDDFGTGYSSLDQLRQLPFFEIKLDRSFVSNAKSQTHAMAILKSSIDLAKKLNLSIVSEGVENQEDYTLLKQLGSDIVQGYYFSKPLPADSLSSWVKNWRKDDEKNISC